MIIAMIVQTVGHNRVKPSVYFSPMAQPTSNSPATVRMIQFMFRAPAAAREFSSERAVVGDKIPVTLIDSKKGEGKAQACDIACVC
jgi:hypothetical protein